MIYIFDKNKIITYVLASCFVLMLFSFKADIIPNKDVDLVKVSSNISEEVNNLNNIYSLKNNY